MSKDFIAQQRWDDSYAELKLEIAPRGDLVRDWLERWVPPGKGACLELGCFPGRYLAVLGALGYEVNGVDLTPRVESDLPVWLKQQGCKVGKFLRADVFCLRFSATYEVVCSLGLIEHFANWANLLEVHTRLVRPGGLLVVAAPNFRGSVQRWLHGWLDRANLGEHNLAAMLPYQWAQCVQPAGFEILTCGWFGAFDFWVKGDPARSRAQRAAIRIIRRLVPLLRHLPKGAAPYAPFCGMVARKSQ